MGNWLSPPSTLSALPVNVAIWVALNLPAAVDVATPLTNKPGPYSSQNVSHNTPADINRRISWFLASSTIKPRSIESTGRRGLNHTLRPVAQFLALK